MNSNTIWISWKNEKPVKHAFDSREGLEAFLAGIAEAHDWLELQNITPIQYEIFDSYEEYEEKYVGGC